MEEDNYEVENSKILIYGNISKEMYDSQQKLLYLVEKFG